MSGLTFERCSSDTCARCERFCRLISEVAERLDPSSGSEGDDSEGENSFGPSVEPSSLDDDDSDDDAHQRADALRQKRTLLRRAYRKHHLVADAGYQLMNGCMAQSTQWHQKWSKRGQQAQPVASNDHVDTVTADFSSGKITPQLPTGPAFYKRKLTVNLYGIVINGMDVGLLWSETVAGKASGNCLSSLRAALESYKAGSSALRLIADNAKQVKTWEALHFCAELVRKDSELRRYLRVDMMFGPVGHTFLESDRFFARVANRARGKIVCSPAEWVEMVRTSREDQPVQARLLPQAEHRNFGQYLQQFYPEDRHKGNKYSLIDARNDAAVPFGKCRWFNLGVGDEGGVAIPHPDEVWVRFSFSAEEPWTKCKLHRVACKQPKRLDHPSFLLHPLPRRLNPGKAKDLEALLKYFPHKDRRTDLEAILEQQKQCASGESSDDSADASATTTEERSSSSSDHH